MKPSDVTIFRINRQDILDVLEVQGYAEGEVTEEELDEIGKLFSDTVPWARYMDAAVEEVLQRPPKSDENAEWAASVRVMHLGGDGDE